MNFTGRYKKWYESKTIWVNVIATISILIQIYSGKDLLPPELQVALLSVINLVLRVITREEIMW